MLEVIRERVDSSLARSSRAHAPGCWWARIPNTPQAGDICDSYVCFTPECIDNTGCANGQICVDNFCIDPPEGNSCGNPIIADAFPFDASQVDLDLYDVIVDQRFVAIRPDHIWHLDFLHHHINRASTFTFRFGALPQAVWLGLTSQRFFVSFFLMVSVFLVGVRQIKPSPWMVPLY